MTRSPKLRRVSDNDPGLRREKRGDGFVYLDPDGSEVTDPETLARIRAIAIPPAYTDVWICPMLLKNSSAKPPPPASNAFFWNRAWITG